MKALNAFLARTIFIVLIALSINIPVQAQKQMTAHLVSSKLVFVRADANDMFVFDLQLANLPETGSLLRVMDEHKNVLFEERINARSYQRRYKINRDEMNTIYFEVSNTQTLLKERFQLSYKVEEKWELIKA